MQHLLLAAWAACVCLGFVGYGKAFLHVCKLHNPPWALAGTLGISLLVAIGGILELAGWVKIPVLVGIVLLGDILFVVTVWRDWSRLSGLAVRAARLLTTDRIAKALFLLLVALSAARLMGNLQPRYFHVNDDLGGYLSFPAEMLQLGALPSDPFSERRITSGLGGSYFLQTFTMVAGDSRTVRFIDWGFGSVLYVGIAFLIGRRLNLSRRNALALALLTFVIPLRRTNSTMVVLPAALFSTLFLLELLTERDGLRAWLRPALMGLTAAAISTLKTTCLPAAVLICALYYFGDIVVRRRVSAWGQGVVCALAAAVCVFPWMLDLRHKEGTYLFPLLGRGYEASAYGTVPLPGGGAWTDLSLWVDILPLVAPFAIAIAAGFIARKLQPKWLNGASLFMAIALSTVIVAFATRGESIARYTLPFIAPGMIVFIAYVVRWSNLLKPRPLWLNVATLCCAAWLGAIVARYGIQAHIYREYIADLGFPPASTDVIKFDLDAEKSRVAAVQQSVPPRQPILEHLLVSYPFDFKRNPIFIADFPGLAGLPPGMPVGKGPLSLRLYLLKNSIRFVAFTYGRGRLVDLSPGVSLQRLIADPTVGGRHAWLYMQNKVALDVQTNWDALSKQYLHIYDDGEACVLDLKALPSCATASKGVL